MNKLLIFFLILIWTANTYYCHHDANYTVQPKRILTNFSKTRLLQTANETGRLRIYMDYTLAKMGGRTEINTIKRAMNISANYFYNTLNVTRIQKLYYEEEKYECGKIVVPAKYGPAGDGVIGDLGIIVSNEYDIDFFFVAQAKICSYHPFNNRPIWGMINWNNAYLKFDQRGFQDLVFAGIHQLVHVLGFSAEAYSKFPSGNPLFTDNSTGLHYLQSPALQRQIRYHFNCSISKGVPLQDQDGSRAVSSHWQSKVFGTQLMGPSVTKNAMMSRFTLALLQSTGWYKSVSYEFAAQPMQWGKNKGCSFLDINDCDSDQFCNDEAFSCELDGSAMGRCRITNFKGPCKTYQFYINTICISQNFQYQNPNGKLNSLERGGHLSRCFSSDFRSEGANATLVNTRCYISVCSPSGKYMFLLVGSYILVCRKPGDVLSAPPGLIGTLTCPKNFQGYCKSKKTCPYHCNKNGACIDGQCLCTGETKLSAFCADVSILTQPVGDTGGLKNAVVSNMGALTDLSITATSTQPASLVSTKKVKIYSINSKCLEGTFFDHYFGICIDCKTHFNCESCDEGGCTICDDGQLVKKKDEQGRNIC